jgi:hypothetical protein
MEQIINRLRVTKETEVTDDILSSKSYYKADFMKPDMLSSTMTWLVGNKFKETPLSMMTVGASGYNNGMSMESKDVGTVDYEYPIMGEIDKYPAISSTIYVAGEKPGLGGTPFNIRFATDWLKQGWIIESSGEVQLKIISVRPLGTEFDYVVELCSGNAASWCPLEEIQAGVQWSALFAPGSFNNSTPPGFGNRVLPGKATNQLTLVRHSRVWKGNVANKAMEIEVPKEIGGGSNYLISYDAFMFEREWLWQKECALWYSIYNKQADGTIYLKEHGGSNEDIPIGAGMLQQIPNVFNYDGTLTYDRLKSIVYDIYGGNQQTHGYKLVLQTGIGGLDAIDKALKGYLTNPIIAGTAVNDKFVTGDAGSDNMKVSGFFSKVRFIGEFEVSVVYNPVFDYGKRAKKSYTHPVTGLPLESYRMVFIDSDNYDGDVNITYVYERGRERIDKHVAGMSQYPKDLPDAPEFVSSAQDQSSTHRMGTLGLTVKRPSLCVHGFIDAQAFQ